MNRQRLGRLGEAKTIVELLRRDLSVYKPIFDNDEIDLLAKDKDRIVRINVRSTSMKTQSGTWSVELRNVSRRKVGVAIKKFDSSKFDVLAVFIEPLDKVVLLDCSKIEAQSIVAILEENDPREWNGSLRER